MERKGFDLVIDKEKLMKPSIYNVFKQFKEGYFIYNTSTAILVKIEKEDYEVLQNKQFITKSDLSSENIYRKLTENKFILDKNINELKELEDNYFLSKNDNSILTITIAPTLNCNFRCHYCYEARESGYITDENINNLLKFIQDRFREYDIKQLNFSWFGGEPLLCVNIIERVTKDVVKLAEQYNVKTRFWVITNGYLLNEKVFNVLQDIPNLEVCITLDGTKKYHDSKRKLYDGSATYDKIISNIQKMQNRNFLLTVRVNIDKDNVDGAFNIIKELYVKNINVDRVYAGHLQQYTDNCEFTQNRLYSVEEFSSVYEVFNSIAYSCNYKKFLIEGLKPIGTYCKAQSNNTYVINYDFSIALCENDIGNSEKSIGNYLASSVEDINKNVVFKKYQELNCFNSDKCKSCKLLPICKGGCPFLWLKYGEPQCPIIKYTFEDNLIRIIKMYARNLALL